MKSESDNADGWLSDRLSGTFGRDGTNPVTAERSQIHPTEPERSA